MNLLTREMAAAIALIVCSAAGCSSPPEEAVLGQFFAAARLRDTTALASFATIRFEPQIDGIVTDFDVTHAAPEQRRPIPGTAASREARRERGERDRPVERGCCPRRSRCHALRGPDGVEGGDDRSAGEEAGRRGRSEDDDCHGSAGGLESRTGDCRPVDHHWYQVVLTAE